MKRGGRLDELFTLLFMIIAVAAVVCFFVARSQPYYQICGGIAIVLRIIQYILRFFA